MEYRYGKLTYNGRLVKVEGFGNDVFMSDGRQLHRDIQRMGLKELLKHVWTRSIGKYTIFVYEGVGYKTDGTKIRIAKWDDLTRSKSDEVGDLPEL